VKGSPLVPRAAAQVLIPPEAAEFFGGQLAAFGGEPPGPGAEIFAVIADVFTLNIHDCKNFPVRAAAESVPGSRGFESRSPVENYLLEFLTDFNQLLNS
jgi:hypothetical protein